MNKEVDNQLDYFADLEFDVNNLDERQVFEKVKSIIYELINRKG